MRRLLVPGFLFVLLLAYALRKSEVSYAAPAITTTDTAATTDSILRRWLTTQAVDDAKPATKTFWFWTSQNDLDSTVKDRTLLRHFDARTFPETLYRKQLGNKKWDKHPLVKLLRGSNYNRIREAWPGYWPVLAEPYEYKPADNQLVKVVLEDSALIVVFHPDRKKNSWEVVDVNGNAVLLPEAMKAAHRIAAVYFSSEKTMKANSYSVTGYRSFILCNESMIKSWHHAVPGVQAQVNNDLAYLLLLHAWFTDDSTRTRGPGKKGANVKSAWKTSEALIPAQGCMKTFRYGRMSADALFTRAVIAEVRLRWRKQVEPLERFPSRGMR